MFVCTTHRVVCVVGEKQRKSSEKRTSRTRQSCPTSRITSGAWKNKNSGFGKTQLPLRTFTPHRSLLREMPCLQHASNLKWTGTLLPCSKVRSYQSLASGRTLSNSKPSHVHSSKQHGKDIRRRTAASQSAAPEEDWFNVALQQSAQLDQTTRVQTVI